MAAASGTKCAATRMLLHLVALYSITNFILLVGSLVAWKKTKQNIHNGKCAFGGIQCGFPAWGIYPLQAAAALISCLVATFMFMHGLLRTGNARLDPLYVFRGVLFSLLTLVPIAIAGWSSLVHVSIVAEPEARSASGLFNTSGDSYPNVTGMGVDFPSSKGVTSSQFVGMGGAYILSTLADVPGTAFAIAIIHFDIIFSAGICGLAVAMAPSTCVPVGMPGMVSSAA